MISKTKKMPVDMIDWISFIIPIDSS